MEEQVLLDEDRVRITTTKAQIWGTTYPMAGLTSVRTVTRTPSTSGAVLLVLAGIGVWMMSTPCVLVAVLEPGTNDLAGIGMIAGGLSGLALLGVGVLAYLTRGATRYAVLLGTAGGDRQALITTDEHFASAVRTAIEEAITRRG